LSVYKKIWILMNVDRAKTIKLRTLTVRAVLVVTDKSLQECLGSVSTQASSCQ